MGYIRKALEKGFSEMYGLGGGSGTQGGGAKKIRGITVFSYPSPLGGVRPEKKYPTPMCKKVSQPHFFLKNTTSCFFILCKRSLHNALRTPNISYFAGTNLDPYISLSAQISATTKRGC